MEIKRCDDKVYVKMEYDPNVIKELERIGKGSWNKDISAWEFPIDKYENLLHIKHHKLKLQLTREERVERLTSHMIRKGYSSNSIKVYTGHLNRFLQYSENRMEISEFNKYAELLLKEYNCSHSYVNQLVSGIKLYGRYTKEFSLEEIISLERPKKEKKLPRVLSKRNIRDIINLTVNEKYKLAFIVAYSLGLRVSEVARLKLEDINESQMEVIINQGNGRKDRILPLSNKLLSHIKYYTSIFAPRKWIFENQVGKHLSSRSFQKSFKKSLYKAGVSQVYTFHSLRHSYATHMLEEGIDLKYIQELLGHASTRTTEKYTHVAKSHLKKLTNPLDTLYDDD